MEYSKRNLDGANQVVSDKLSSLVAWRFNGHSAEVRTSRVIILTLNIFKFKFILLDCLDTIY